MEYHHINSGRIYSIIYYKYRGDRKLHLPHGDYIDKSLKEEVSAMFKNRTPDGTNNIAGIRVTELRKGLRISQRELADRLAVIGLNIDKNAVQRIESGQRFITDIELVYLAKIFNVTVEDLLRR